MQVKNNYEECITNFACSIRKYFGLDYKHNTLKYIDEILENQKPKNVVTILCDGMGSNILDRVLEKDSFLIKNKLKSITTVFPATTVAATTSMMTGLNPVETGMLGWTMYYKDIDKTITTFFHSEKSDPDYKPLEEARNYNHKNMITKSIMDEINEKAIDKAYKLFPFGEGEYKDLDEMFSTIKNKCEENGKKYIYAYYDEPDCSMHEYGCDSNIAINIIKDINNRVEKLSNEIDNTIIFVVADHGHINVDNIFIKDYPDIIECLLRTTSIESRAVNFFIKNDKKEQFVTLFNNYFSNDFDLYTKKEIIESKIFGDGTENKIFRDALGDYMAIAKSNKALLNDDNEVLKSMHAGYTDDEIYIPLIVINTNKSGLNRGK